MLNVGDSPAHSRKGRQSPGKKKQYQDASQKPLREAHKKKQKKVEKKTATRKEADAKPAIEFQEYVINLTT
jgi:hypothetical protein